MGPIWRRTRRNNRTWRRRECRIQWWFTTQRFQQSGVGGGCLTCDSAEWLDATPRARFCRTCITGLTRMYGLGSVLTVEMAQRFRSRVLGRP